MLVYSETLHPITIVDKDTKEHCTLATGWNHVNDKVWDRVSELTMMKKYIDNELVSTKKELPKSTTAVKKIMENTFAIHEIESMKKVEVSKKDVRQDILYILDSRIKDLEQEIQKRTDKKRKGR